jgi:Flp pilus assembly pilin Flp
MKATQEAETMQFDSITRVQGLLAAVTRRLRREDGQGNIEYLGVTTAASLIALAVIGAASGIGGMIATEISNVVTDLTSSLP